MLAPNLTLKLPGALRSTAGAVMAAAAMVGEYVWDLDGRGHRGVYLRWYMANLGKQRKFVSGK